MEVIYVRDNSNTIKMRMKKVLLLLEEKTGQKKSQNEFVTRGLEKYLDMWELKLPKLKLRTQRPKSARTLRNS